MTSLIIGALFVYVVNYISPELHSSYNQGVYSLSGKTSYRQISWSLEVARLTLLIIVSL